MIRQQTTLEVELELLHVKIKSVLVELLLVLGDDHIRFAYVLWASRAKLR